MARVSSKCGRPPLLHSSREPLPDRVGGPGLTRPYEVRTDDPLWSARGSSFHGYVARSPVVCRRTVSGVQQIIGHGSGPWARLRHDPERSEGPAGPAGGSLHRQTRRLPVGWPGCSDWLASTVSTMSCRCNSEDTPGHGGREPRFTTSHPGAGVQKTMLLHSCEPFFPWLSRCSESVPGGCG